MTDFVAEKEAKEVVKEGVKEEVKEEGKEEGKNGVSNDDEKAVHAFLDSFHHLAATAKFEEYFSLFHPNGQFLGTDGTENWTVQQFKDWSKQFFMNVECAWEYIPVPNKRIVSVQHSSEGRQCPTYAVFDEVLYCVDLKCHTRGSGTLVYENNKWLLMLYHITFPIPDRLNQFVTTKIIEGKKLNHQKTMLSMQEAKASAALEQLLLEVDLEDKNGAASSSKSGKNQKKKKKK